MHQINTVHPMPKQNDASTLASVAAARAYCASQRLAYGFNPDPDAPPIEVGPAAVLRFELTAKPIPERTLPMERQLDLNDAVDGLVEEYGLQNMIRALRMVASVNGVTL
jgi:hypothetical protein